MKNIRKDNEQPEVIQKFGWRYHHLGIPTKTSLPNEKYIPHLKITVSGFDTNPFGIEWMRFDEDCEVHDLIRSMPHLAFEVDNIETALEGKDLIYPINSPSKGVKTAMIIYDGFPIELLEFEDKIA